MCALCEHEADDVLLLQCSHVICLPCGSYQMQQQATSRPLSVPNSIFCPLCDTETLLTDKTAATIIRAPPKRVQPRERRTKLQPAAATFPAAAAASGEAPAAKQTLMPQGPPSPQPYPPKGTPLTQQALATAEAITPRDLLGPPYADASHEEWPFLCSLCERLSASLYCRDCVRAYCSACAVEAHAPEGEISVLFSVSFISLSLSLSVSFCLSVCCGLFPCLFLSLSVPRCLLGDASLSFLSLSVSVGLFSLQP